MIIIGGSTASGKTSLAAEVSKRLNGEIVSADSMQIYKGMDIGTAKAGDAELGVKQHLIDIVEPNESFSVVDYRLNAEKAIRDIENRGKIPVIAGGTGFYITSLLTEYGYGNESDIELKNQLFLDLEQYGAIFMHEKLKALDPVSAEKIHYNNTKRVLRALEVCLVTGKPFSNQQNIKYNPISPFIMFIININRELLYNRIEKRVDIMINNGLEEELRELLQTKNLNFAMQSMQGIGYKEWKPYFEGDNYTIDEVANVIKKNTKAYAKRQQTWFAHQYNRPIFIDGSLSIEEMADTVCAHIKNYHINNN